MDASILLHCVDQHTYCTSLSKDFIKGRVWDICMFTDCLYLLPHNPSSHIYGSG